jgi:tRNA (adenine57-N1/adenine58-N1)-methyltransferase
VTYEVDPEFAEVARDNAATAGVADRVDVRTGDVCDVVEDPDARDELGPVDVVTLDTADAPEVVPSVPDLLVPGGFLAVYAPFVEQSRAVAEAAREAGLADVRTVETIQREMDFDDRGSRPSTAGVGHTGFLTFARRP